MSKNGTNWFIENYNKDTVTINADQVDLKIGVFIENC